MQFQQDWPKDKTITGLSIFGGKLRKICSTDLNGAPLEGSTNFLYRSSFGHTALESCRLAELKYAIFSRTGCKTEKLRRSKLFLPTVLKHWLQEGSTILLQYCAKTHTP